MRNRSSPFPGMDPYLENYWRDVHATFLAVAKQQLNRQLPADLAVRIEEGVAVRSGSIATRVIYPDISVIEEPESEYETPNRTATAVGVPFEVILEEPPPSRHLEIVDCRDGNRIVTVIELLSPKNKSSVSGRDEYRRKQTEVLRSGANLVEIDLLRRGQFVLAMPQEQWPEQQLSDYKICIRRATRPSVAAGMAMSLREPLPSLPVPLRPSDPDVVMELQVIIDTCYRDGRYASLDYRAPLQPVLSDEDQRWFQQRLVG